MVQLQAGQRPVGVDCLGGQPQGPGVTVVPDLRGYRREIIGVRRDRGVLHAHPSPAALRLDSPERRLRPGFGRAEPRRVRDLVEPVRQCFRADPDRLEQDGMPVVHGVAPGPARSDPGSAVLALCIQNSRRPPSTAAPWEAHRGTKSTASWWPRLPHAHTDLATMVLDIQAGQMVTHATLPPWRHDARSALDAMRRSSEYCDDGGGGHADGVHEPLREDVTSARPGAVARSAGLPERCPAVVVGGGVLGLSSAYDLARHNLSVVLLESGRVGG